MAGETSRPVCQQGAPTNHRRPGTGATNVDGKAAMTAGAAARRRRKRSDGGDRFDVLRRWWRLQQAQCSNDEPGNRRGRRSSPNNGAKNRQRTWSVGLRHHRRTVPPVSGRGKVDGFDFRRPRGRRPPSRRPLDAGRGLDLPIGKALQGARDYQTVQHFCAGRYPTAILTKQHGRHRRSPRAVPRTAIKPRCSSPANKKTPSTPRLRNARAGVIKIIGRRHL